MIHNCVVCKTARIALQAAKINTLNQWSATAGPRPGAGPCEVCYRSVCVFRINALG